MQFARMLLVVRYCVIAKLGRHYFFHRPHKSFAIRSVPTLHLPMLTIWIALGITSATMLLSGCSSSADGDREERERLLLDSEMFAMDGDPEVVNLPPALSASGYPRTDVLPHMEAPISPGRNYVYCATMKMASEQVMGSNASGSDLAQALSRVQFTEADLDPSSYFKFFGTYDEAIKRLLERFPAAEDDLPEIVMWVGDAWFVYLEKSLPFREKFDRKDHALDFTTPAGTVKVSGFGVDQLFLSRSRDFVLSKQVTIRDFQNNDDFVLELNTLLSGDRIILAKISPEKTLLDTVTRVQSRVERGYSKSSDESRLQDGERMMVPIVSFGVLKDYFGGTASQMIKFRLDESGARLRAHVTVLALGEEGKPRQFVFNKPFLLYLVQRNSDHPYLAMWIANEEFLER